MSAYMPDPPVLFVSAPSIYRRLPVLFIGCRARDLGDGSVYA